MAFKMSMSNWRVDDGLWRIADIKGICDRQPSGRRLTRWKSWRWRLLLAASERDRDNMQSVADQDYIRTRAISEGRLKADPQRPGRGPVYTGAYFKTLRAEQMAEVIDRLGVPKMFVGGHVRDNFASYRYPGTSTVPGTFKK